MEETRRCHGHWKALITGIDRWFTARRGCSSLSVYDTDAHLSWEKVVALTAASAFSFQMLYAVTRSLQQEKNDSSVKAFPTCFIRFNNNRKDINNPRRRFRESAQYIYWYWLGVLVCGFFRHTGPVTLHLFWCFSWLIPGTVQNKNRASINVFLAKLRRPNLWRMNCKN